MRRYRYLRPCHGSNAHGFLNFNVEEARKEASNDRHRPFGPVMIWAIEPKCGRFAVDALGEPDRTEVCVFCVRAARRKWLVLVVTEPIIFVWRQRWKVRAAVEWVDRRMWGRP